MKVFSRAALLAVVLVVLGIGAASAQDPYGNPGTPQLPPSDTVPTQETNRGNTSEQCIPDDDAVDSDGPGGTDDEVLCDTNDSDSDSDVLPDDADTDESDPVDSVRPGTAETDRGTGDVAAAEQTAPSGSLPFTGADVAGLTAIGAVALAVGLVLVRRSRAMKRAA